MLIRVDGAQSKIKAGEVVQGGNQLLRVLHSVSNQQPPPEFRAILWEFMRRSNNLPNLRPNVSAVLRNKKCDANALPISPMRDKDYG